MRVLVITSGDGFSTSDVGDGLAWGLRQQPGVTVYEYPLLQELEQVGLMRAALVERCEREGLVAPAIDVFAYAARGIPGVVMHREITHVIAVTGSKLPWTIPATLRRGGVHCALLATESPYLTWSLERHTAAIYDTVFTNERLAPPLFTQNDPASVHYLPHAYHPARHRPDGPALDPCDVRFVGTMFPERAALFGAVDWTGLRWDCRGVTIDPDAADVRTVLSQITPNEQTAALYRGAGIVLNHHRTVRQPGGDAHIGAGEAESLGPRAYEIAACGAFQLCDDSRPELADVFGDAVPTYRAGDADDLGRLIRHYHARPDARARLAAAAAEAVAPHHWGARAAAILEILSAPRRGSVHPGLTLATA